MGAGEHSVLVSITSCQSDGGEENGAETVYPGKGYEKEGCYYVFYEEIDPDDQSVTKVSLRISPDRITTRKRGAVNTEMTFVLDECLMAEYDTPYGIIDLLVSTERLEVRREEKGLTAELEYRLSLGGSESVTNELTIKVTER